MYNKLPKVSVYTNISIKLKSAPRFVTIHLTNFINERQLILYTCDSLCHVLTINKTHKPLTIK